MVRIVLGVLVGSIIVVAVSLLFGGLTAAIFHVTGLDHADSDHPHTALAVPGLLVLAAGGLVGGAAGVFAGLRISRWAPALWIIGVVGALYTYITSELFANKPIVLVACLIALALGCWLGGRAGASRTAPEVRALPG
jgi:hypothetical protein